MPSSRAHRARVGAHLADLAQLGTRSTRSDDAVAEGEYRRRSRASAISTLGKLVESIDRRHAPAPSSLCRLSTSWQAGPARRLRLRRHRLQEEQRGRPDARRAGRCRAAAGGERKSTGGHGRDTSLAFVPRAYCPSRPPQCQPAPLPTSQALGVCGLMVAERGSAPSPAPLPCGAAPACAASASLPSASAPNPAPRSPYERWPSIVRAISVSCRRLARRLSGKGPRARKPAGTAAAA